ncbi:hypothetical protein ACIQOU_10365 [Streptomyces sp. NPDC091279]|uniref:hypothetical protein n=1 Tax=Streptomyces sp. NPDC091279 TaxID=3365983 RepID=UPI0038112B82
MSATTRAHRGRVRRAGSLSGQTAVETWPRQDAVRQDAVRQDAVRQDAVRQDAVRQDAVRQDAVL